MKEDRERDQAIEHLTALCRGEIAAVETYNQAMSSQLLSRFWPQLRRCQRSHQDRVYLLNWRIQLLGGDPPDSSGAWGFFAKVVEGTATALGERAALLALEEGEDHGLSEYNERCQKLDSDSQLFLQQRILPLQAETHGLIRVLREDMTSAAPEHAAHL
jgi:hypothetical protein